MERRLFLASALGLLIPGVALAQSDPRSRERPGGGSNQGPGSGQNRPGGPGNAGGPGGGRPPGGSGGNPGGGNPGGGRPGGGRPGPERPGGGRPPGGDHRLPTGGSRPPPRPQPGPPTGPHRPGGRPPGFRPVRGPRWRYPSGYRYRRWSVGLLLPSLFLNNAYYFDDYGRMGLGGPPWGYRWVRYGPDLLLVETRTGRIEDVIYGAFY